MEEKLKLSPVEVNSLVAGPNDKVVAVGGDKLARLGAPIVAEAQAPEVPVAPVVPTEPTAAAMASEAPVTPTAPVVPPLESTPTVSSEVPAGVVDAVNNFYNEPSSEPMPQSAFSPTSFAMPNVPVEPIAPLAPQEPAAPVEAAMPSAPVDAPVLTDPMAGVSVPVQEPLNVAPASLEPTMPQSEMPMPAVGLETPAPSPMASEVSPMVPPVEPTPSFVPEYRPEPIAAPVLDSVPAPVTEPEPVVPQESVAAEEASADMLTQYMERLKMLQEEESILTMMIEEQLYRANEESSKAM